ncbi:MAG: hypothetical protein ABIO84_08080 [Lysobacter sp.]
MLRAAVVLVLLSSAGVANAQSASCGALSAPSMPVQRTVIAPVAVEFSTPGRQLGAPSGVLSQALSDSLSVDQVLFRLQVESCGALASIAPIASPGSLPARSAEPGAAASTTPAAAATDPAAYKPRTEFDNTPWRFDMNQNGERMTAEAFAAWMESKGVRVAKGRPKPAAVEGAVAEGASPGTAPAPVKEGVVVPPTGAEVD